MGLPDRISTSLHAASKHLVDRDRTERVPDDKCFLMLYVGHRDREQASPSRFQSVVSRDRSCWRPTIRRVSLQALPYDCPSDADLENRKSTYAHPGSSLGGESAPSG